MRTLFFAAALLVCNSANAMLVFSENVGPGVASPGTQIALYAGWQNFGTLTFTGSTTGSTVTNNPPTSSGYTGASGNGYVNLKTSPVGTTNFEISSINTSAYDGTFTLTFGAAKAAADTMANLLLAYSSDGTNYTPISIPAQNDGTADWRLLTFSNIALPVVPNLRLRWTDNAKVYQLDDIALNGTITAVPEASSFLAVGLVALGAFLIRKLKAAASQSHTRMAH